MADEQPPLIDLADLVNNPLAKVSISGLGGAPVVGYHHVEFSFGASNQYNNPFESEAQAKLSAVANKVLPAASGALNYFTGNKGEVPSAQFSLKSFNQTIEAWTGCEKPHFPITLTFIALHPSDDVRKPMKKIMRGVMPNKGSLSGALGGLNVITAPLGYGPQLAVGQSKGNPNNTVSLFVAGTLVLSIGKWFKGYGLVLKEARPRISKQTIRSGLPLWCEVDCTFQPYRQLSNAEFASFFP